MPKSWPKYVAVGVVLVCLVGIALYIAHRSAISKQEQSMTSKLAALDEIQKRADSDLQSLRRDLTSLSDHQRAASTVSGKRHDDAVNGYPDFSQELIWAKQEQGGVQALQTDYLGVQQDLNRLAADYARVLGDDAVATLRAHVVDFATQFGLADSNWDRAVSDVVDNLKAITDGQYSGPNTNSDISNLYQASSDAETRALVDMQSSFSDLDHLKGQLAHEINSDRDDLARLRTSR